MNRSLKLALAFSVIAIALTALESRSCLAQDTKPSPSTEAIDGNVIDSIELTQGDSKKLSYNSPISKVYISETYPSASKAISIEFVSRDSVVVTGQKLGVAIITLHTPDQPHKKLTVNVMPDMTRRPRKTLAGDKEQRSQKITSLIDSLADLDSQTIGIHWNSDSSLFIPNLPIASKDNTPKHIQTMAKLIAMGEEVIPNLLNRMSDKTPTKLSIKPADYVMNRWYSNEYSEYDPKKPYKEERFEEDYQVKIGDVCFVLIGQIVNRPYQAVRYQASGCMVVNSPVHMPELKQLAVSDWQNTDEAKLKASLLKDLKSRNPFTQEGTIARLNYYFPNLDDISEADSKQTPTN